MTANAPHSGRRYWGCQCSRRRYEGPHRTARGSPGPSGVPHAGPAGRSCRMRHRPLLRQAPCDRGIRTLQGDSSARPPAAYRGVSVPFEETTTQTRILRISVNGGLPETILTLPFEEIGSVTMFPDGRRFVCTVYSSRSDVWIVEDFDVSSRSRLARRQKRQRYWVQSNIVPARRTYSCLSGRISGKSCSRFSTRSDSSRNMSGFTCAA